MEILSIGWVGLVCSLGVDWKLLGAGAHFDSCSVECLA